MKDTLKTIQTFSNVARIVSKVIMILCIIGACACLVGLVLLPLGSIADISYLILQLIPLDLGEAMGATCVALVAGIILCAGEAVTAGFANRYFQNELAAGTPFTFDGAKEMMRLGVIAIFVPLGANVLAAIAAAILTIATSSQLTFHWESDANIPAGIVFLAMALIFKYGAEVAQGKEEAKTPEVAVTTEVAE